MIVPERGAGGAIKKHRFVVAAWGPVQPLAGEREYLNVSLTPSNPIDAGRSARLDPSTATNKPASLELARLNIGRLFLNTDTQIAEAAGREKRLPQLQGYVLVAIDGKPTYVEAALWPRHNAGTGQMDFLSGIAEIHDPAVAAAATAKHEALGPAEQPNGERARTSRRGPKPPEEEPQIPQ